MTTTALSRGCARAARCIPWLHALAQHANIQSKSDHRELITCNHFLFRAASFLVLVTAKCSSVFASAAKRCRRGAGTRRLVEARLHFSLHSNLSSSKTFAAGMPRIAIITTKTKDRVVQVVPSPSLSLLWPIYELNALHLRSRTAFAVATLCHPLSLHSARAVPAALRRRAISAIASVTVLERLDIIGFFGL
jgi:hypothetical protein